MTKVSVTELKANAGKCVEMTQEAISDILSMFDISAVDDDVCSMALITDMRDFEGAVLAVCAANERADYIVTGGEVFIRGEGCPVPTIPRLACWTSSEILDKRSGAAQGAVP